MFLMVKNKNSPKRSTYNYKEFIYEADGIYFLKLIVVAIISTLWIKLSVPLSWGGIPFGGFPIGALLALIIIRVYEKDLLDRKIWFAVVLIISIISYFVPAGIVL